MGGDVISSRTNARVKQLRAAFAGQVRLSGGLVAVEGEHLVEEAVRSGVPLTTVFVSEGWQKKVPRGVEVVRLKEDVFLSAVETQAPQGIAALLAPPVFGLSDVLGQRDGSAPLILVAAGLQDPGNLGTLVRSAEAFGATGVLTLPGTVSVWNQKALRASAGSVFRVPVVGVGASEVEGLKRRGLRLIAAVGSEDADVVAAPEMDFTAACALMIGNEGNGLAAEWISMCNAQVTIPYPGPVESLNAAVAGSLLLYEASRQRHTS